MYAEDGGEGRGISGISNKYAISNDGTTAPTSGWQDNPMSPTSSAKYLWNKEIVTYTKGSPATTETVRVIGTYSAPGSNGYNQATIYLYARQASAPAAPSSSLTYTFSSGTLSSVPSPWSQTFPQNNGYPCYMAVAVAISNTSTDTIDSNDWVVQKLVENGINGQNGRGISSTAISYQISNDGTYDPSGTWSSTIPQSIDQGKWLITRTIIIYTDNTDSTSYTKAYIGEDGAQGQPGTNGNGIASTSILYAVTNDNVQPASGSSSWQGTLPTFGEGKWLWIKTIITYDNGDSDESVSKSYTGTDGQDGISITVTNTSYNPTTKTTTVTMSDGSSFQIKDGEDGENGSPGAPGTDGTPSYTHFAWANSSDGTVDFSTTVSTNKLYIGVYADSTQQDSSQPSDYNWTLIKGADGEDGQDGDDGYNQATIFLYQRSDSALNAPTGLTYTFSTGQIAGNLGGWSRTVPSGTSPCYVTSAAVISKVDSGNTLTFVTPTVLVENGIDGTSVTVVSTEYQEGTSYNTAPSGTWSSTPVQVAQGNYLWTKVTYSDGSIAYSVSRQGEDGQDAGQFSIHTNVEEILKFNSGEFFGNKIKYSFSSDVIQINGYDLSIQQFFPITNYSAIIKIYGQNLKDVIKEEYYDLYVYNENGDLNSYYFDLKKLYNDLYSGDLDNRINSTYSSMISTLKNFFESQNSEDIEIFAQITLSNNSVVNVEKFLQVKNGLSEEMARFDVNASNITAAIQDAGLIFNSNGLTVTNSGFKIRSGNDNDGYTNIFYIDDNTGLLYMNGNGVFHGNIYADSGEFSGTVNASSGSIGGFTINTNSIISDNLELHSTYTENGVINESFIKVKNIEIGNGAEVKGSITIGNLKLLNPDENNGNVLTLTNNNANYFTLTDEGGIIGNNWSILNTQNGVVADFGKIIARDGEFSGTIHATDGDFTGSITSSVINASTINAASFVTEKTRAMGGTFIFKPTFQIQNIETTEQSNVFEITLTGDNNNIEDYIPELNISGEDVIVSLSGNDTRYGKIVDKDETKIYVYFYNTDYNTVLNQLESYNTATIFGYGNYTDLLIGINSDDNTSVLPPRSLVMSEFTNLINNSGTGNINYQIRLLLGDLADAPEGPGVGYGLYADNVFLRGSLTTSGASGITNSYAGINTQRAIQFNYNLWNDGSTTTPTIYTEDKIIFWGGAQGATDNQIQVSPFIVTDKGNIFARSGEFKGSVISDSLITNTVIKAPIIQGNNTTPNEPSLKIYNTDSNKVGIGFYKQVGNIDENGGETDDILTLILSNNGFAHYYNNNRRLFITFEENSNQISIDADNLNIGSTSLRQNYLQDGQSYIQINDNINGIKLANTGANIQVLTNEIINDATTITNKNSMIIRNGSGTEMLKYTVNNGYYCLYVEE